VQEGYTTECGEVAAVLERAGAAAAFDLILLDPPYDIPDIGDVLDAASRRLAGDGLVVLERASRREPAVPASLTRVRDVKSGDSTLTFFVAARTL
jgi:16S rRNA (guanine966-N2)-methyltransferase